MGSEDDTNWKILKTLEGISRKLDALIIFTKLGQKKELLLLRDQILGKSKIRRNVYENSNGDMTINEIAKKLKQKGPNVSREISYLQESGLLTVKKIGSKKFPQKTLI